MTIDELIAREQIRDVIHRYCRAVDRGDRKLLKSVYHDDATDNHGTFRGMGVEFADHIVEALDEVDHVGQHHVTNILMEVEGESAAVESYFLALHPRRSSSGDRQHVFVGGRYLDRFERRLGRWRIVRREVVIDWSRAGLSGEDMDRVDEFTRGGRRENDFSSDWFAWI